MNEKIKTLLENKEFASKLAECKDIKAAKALFAEYGAELTDELLSDDALASVAGGALLVAKQSNDWYNDQWAVGLV